MTQRIIERVNSLFDSYDLFSSRQNKIKETIKEKFPDITEEEIDETDSYLKEFFHHCCKYAHLLADKYKVPWLPKGEEAQKETDTYVIECQKQYPEIDREHIISLFSTYCWLSNR